MAEQAKSVPAPSPAGLQKFKLTVRHTPYQDSECIVEARDEAHARQLFASQWGGEVSFVEAL